MPTTEFSEFSYGYALTSSLVAALGKALKKAPIFPSLIEEGSAGGGYDLKLPTIPVPVFIQFKVPNVLARKSKLLPPGYLTPYYRMPLRTKHPNQHQLLLTLEAKEPLVFYATPLFHEVAELDTHFATSSVATHSAFVRPSQIGALAGTSHQLSYQPGAATYWVFSEPHGIEQQFGVAEFLKLVSVERAAARGRLDVTPDSAFSDSLRQRVIRTEIDRLAEVVLTVERDAELAEYGLWAPGSASNSKSIPQAQPDRAEIRTERLRSLIAASDDPVAKAKRLAYYVQVHLGLAMTLVDALDAGQ